jgi:two-component system sensor histidine kinase KdpD
VIERFWTNPPSAPWRYGVALACVAAVTPLVALLRVVFAANLTVLYVPAVIVAAVLTGVRPALAASLAAFVVYDVLFVSPQFTLRVRDPQEWVNLLVFLATAVATSQIAGVARTRGLEAQRNERESATQFRLIRALTESASLDAGLEAAAAALADETGSDAVAVVLAGRLRAGAGAAAVLRQIEVPGVLTSAAIVARRSGDVRRWVHARAVPADRSLDAFGRVRIEGVDDSSNWLVLHPLQERLRDPRTQRTLLVAAALIGQALSRARLQADAHEAAVLREVDRLRASMLNAVSHDLRTPLSSMIASAESLLQPDVTWSPAEQREFLHDIVVEGQWLDRMVRHLLDFSRIQAGALRLAPSWVEPQDLLDDVARRLAPLISEHPLAVDVPTDLPAILVDEVACAEVIANLVENAVKHTPPGTQITVSAREFAGAIEITVDDLGPGIPPGLLPRLFEAFAPGRRSSGSGLGLAIARALVEAHGGRLYAENRAGGGTSMIATFPQPTHEPDQRDARITEPTRG